MDLIIERLNGDAYHSDELGLKIQRFKVGSPSYQNNSGSVLGRDGIVPQGGQYGARNIDVSGKVFAADALDFPLKRNELFNVFQSKEPFYITDSREPAKQWLVNIPNSYDIDQLYQTFGDFSITFQTYKLPNAQSMGTSLNPRRFDEEIWQVGQGLVDEEEDTNYVHSTTSFQIYNSSDITVDPRVHELLITFEGPSSGLSITNETTGETFVYNGSTATGDTLEIKGIQMLKNGSSIFRDTNHQLNTLAPGYNDFTINGATEGEFEITFDFRFYYF